MHLIRAVNVPSRLSYKQALSMANFKTNLLTLFKHTKDYQFTDKMLTNNVF